LINFCSQSEDKNLQDSTIGCCYLSQTEAKVMMTMMQHTNCVVKTDKVQTVKLTLYRYKYHQKSYVPAAVVYCRLQSTKLAN